VEIVIRDVRTGDPVEVGRLIARVFRRYNLSYASPAEQEKLLGPFRHAESTRYEHRLRIAELIRAPIVLVAEAEGRIVGVLRGRHGRLHSLFVEDGFHGRGIGRRLVEAFEARLRAAGCEKITLQSTLLAVPFYQRLGYARSTGVRSGRCFDGDGFRYQPMRKLL